MNSWVEVVKYIIFLLVIVDPVGNLPRFAALTSEMSRQSRRATYRTAVGVAFLILVVFALVGRQILESIFRVNLWSFSIAGGLLLLVVSVEILRFGRPLRTAETVVIERSIGAVPLGCPLLAGPGAITATLLMAQSFGPAGIYLSLISIVAVLAIVAIILHFADSIYGFLGEAGANVFARIMGIFIAAIAVQFIIKGIAYSFNLPLIK